MQFTGVGGIPNKEGEEFLTPGDAFLSFSDGNLKYSNIFKAIITALANVASKTFYFKKMYIKICIDACFSGNAIEYMKSDEFTTETFSKEIRDKLNEKKIMFYVYTSCAYNEFASDDGQKGGGKFTNDRFRNIKDDEFVDYYYLNNKTETFYNDFDEEDSNSYGFKHN